MEINKQELLEAMNKICNYISSECEDNFGKDWSFPYGLSKLKSVIEDLAKCEKQKQEFLEMNDSYDLDYVSYAINN